jgi:hypothetical protein
MRVWRLPASGGYLLLPSSAPAPSGAEPVSEAAELTRYLSAKLLEPLKDALGAKRQWILSPDGPLAQLPLELLPFGERGEPAIVATDIHYTQSFSVLALMRAKQREYDALRDRKLLFAMGNPEYEQAAINPGARRSLARSAPLKSAEQLRDLDDQ